MGLILNMLISTFSIMLSAFLIPGIHVQDLWTGIVIAVVMGVINTFVKPIIKILTLPITVLTLGLFLLVINVLIVYFVAWVVPGFTIDSFWDALFFSIAVSLINAFLSRLAD